MIALTAGCGGTAYRAPGSLPSLAAVHGHDAVPASDRVTDVPVQREPWSFEGASGQIITTPHYRLHTTIRRRALREVMPLFMERSLAHYTSAIVPLPAPPQPLETYLLADRGQWEMMTRRTLANEASRYLGLGRGGFTTRGTSVLYDIGRADTLAIAAHEGWHQYTQQTFQGTLPIWLEEGMATYMEGYISHPDGLPRMRPWANLERYHALRDAWRDQRLIPLRQLLIHRPESFLDAGTSSLLVYYAQVWALVHFLVEGEDGRHRPGLQRLLLDVAQGQATGRGDRLLKRYFGLDAAALEGRYLSFVGRAVRVGGRDHAVQGASPVAR